MKYVALLLLTLYFYALTPARSQSIVQGRVIDQETHEPLEYAVVTSVRSGQSVVTDAAGSFSVRLAHPTDSFSISFVGYRRVCVCADQCSGVCKPGSSCCNEFAMEKQGTDLRSVIITPCPNATSHTIGLVDLGLRPVNTAQDLMRLVPGLFIGQHQGGGLAEHIFYRGFDADHGTDVNVSVDGMPLNLVSHIHGQGFADLHFLIPELVTKIDYGKGPYYAEYGDFTTAGYVAFRTADVLDRSEVKLEGGQFNTGRIMAKVNLFGGDAPSRRANAYLAGEAAYTDGPFVWAQHLRRLNLYGKYNVELSQRTKLTATLSSYDGGWRSSGEIPQRAVKEGMVGRFGYIDSAQGGITGRYNVIMRLRTEIPGGLRMDQQAYYSYYYFTLHYDPTFFADDSINGDQLRQQETRKLAGYSGRLSHHAYFANGTDLLSAAGIGTQANWIGLSSLAHTKDGNKVLENLEAGVPREYTANIWLDENYHVGKWLFNLGTRLDWMWFSYRDDVNPQYPARGKWISSPKVNLSYNRSQQLQFYVKAGKGFHSNDVRVVTGRRGLDVLPAAYGTDLGVNWKPLPGLLLNAAVWTLYLQQEFVYDGDEGTMDPGNKTIRKGIDLAARYQFTHWLFAHVDLNICNARDLQAAKGANYLPLAVPFCSTGSLDFKARNGINGAISYRYMKDRPANADNTLIAKGYFVSDLVVNYTRKKWEAGFDIQNLFNTAWREAQFETMSRLRGEPGPVDDISFTPGTRFFAKLRLAVFF